ncbi:MAG: diacylglycerol/lipid kinase family protein [Steroidobacteraceae bacterium]
MVDENPWCLVVNPAAANGTCGRRWATLEPRLRTAGCRFEATLTGTPEALAGTVDDALDRGFKRFLAAGGDGSLNQLAQVLLSREPDRSSELAIGVLPLGSGNDWAAWRGLALDSAARDLACARLGPLDAGVVTFDDGTTPRYFLNVAGAGLDGWLLARMQGQAHGHRRYLTEAIRGLFSFAPAEFKLDSPGGRLEGSGLTTVVALGPRCGGGMRLATGLRQQGDDLECLLVRPITLPADLKVLGSLHNGRLASRGYARLIKSSLLRIETDRPVPVQVDGEPVGQTPCTIRLLPGALQGLLPAAPDYR